MLPGVASLPPAVLLRKRKRLVRELLDRENLIEVRVAVLGHGTTNELVDFLELLLANEGFRPVFHQGDYGRYYEESVLDPSALVDFKPDVVVLNTSSGAIRHFPPFSASQVQVNESLSAEVSRYSQIWNSILQHTSAMIIQNNFEPPLPRVLGNRDAVDRAGRVRFCNRLNELFAEAAEKERRILLNDQATVASTIGLERFIDPMRGFQYKIATTVEGSLELARSVTAIFRAIYGKSRKCLVLDLDNTLWGGVIGDDGPDKIRIGKETAEAEAYTAFQEYCLSLRERGVLLAVCSKNTDSIARQGFEHPESVLKIEHFASFKANWNPKHENLAAIARELNIGLDSLVFIDDNPAERALVASQLPVVAVPDVGDDVTGFIRIIERERYFEPLSLSSEDLSRASQYAANSQRSNYASQFADYGEYLDSLQMKAEIGPFKPVYLDRITQLINKTNQFNLTTKRYTAAEVEEVARNAHYIHLYGKLTDVFGDNGLISVVIGRLEDATLHIETWLMSCRVLKREFELAMLDTLVAYAQANGAREIIGTYIRTPKNGLVVDHYDKLGFECARADNDNASVWRARFIRRLSPQDPPHQNRGPSKHIRKRKGSSECLISLPGCNPSSKTYWMIQNWSSRRKSNAHNVYGWDSLARY